MCNCQSCRNKVVSNCAPTTNPGCMTIPVCPVVPPTCTLFAQFLDTAPTTISGTGLSPPRLAGARNNARVTPDAPPSVSAIPWTFTNPDNTLNFQITPLNRLSITDLEMLVGTYDINYMIALTPFVGTRPTPTFAIAVNGVVRGGASTNPATNTLTGSLTISLKNGDKISIVNTGTGFIDILNAMIFFVKVA